MDNHEDIKDLWDRYLVNQCTVEEVQQLLLFVQSEENNPLALEMIENGFDGDLSEKLLTHPQVDFILTEAFENITARTTPKPKTKTISFRLVRYAAAAILFLSLGWAAYMIFLRQALPTNELVKSEERQVPSGINQVVLTIGNGKEIKLNEASGELLSNQYHLPVRKLADALLYTGTAESNDAEYHTVVTSKGSQYRIELSDGTKVWLNAASSLTYPTVFNGKHREVELTGEGYFEVAKNAHKPFYVKVNKMQVAVLGTIFNVNAYTNEKSVKTTLLEGSVKITAAGDSGAEMIIKPGEQAILNSTGGLEKMKVNGADFIGWKQDVFRFSGNHIDLILRQISRWYDVDIEYQNGIPNIEINGEMPRNTKLEDMVNVLKNSGLDIRIQHKKLIVK